MRRGGEASLVMLTLIDSTPLSVEQSFSGVRHPVFV